MNKWIVVTSEPTLAMVLAGEDAFDDQLNVRLGHPQPYPSEEKAELSARVAYRAMTRQEGVTTQWLWRIPGRGWVLVDREDDVTRAVKINGEWIDTEIIELNI